MNYLIEYLSQIEDGNILVGEELKKQLDILLKDLENPRYVFDHILRVRGILDHVDQVGKYEHIIPEPWYTMMIEYKKNWNNNKGKEYMSLLREALNYIENYRDRVISNELG
jgi:hypothetical protein